MIVCPLLDPNCPTTDSPAHLPYFDLHAIFLQSDNIEGQRWHPQGVKAMCEDTLSRF